MTFGSPKTWLQTGALCTIAFVSKPQLKQYMEIASLGLFHENYR